MVLTCFLRNNHRKPLWFSPMPQSLRPHTEFCQHLWEIARHSNSYTQKSLYDPNSGPLPGKIRGSKQPGVFPFQAPGVNNRWAESSRVGFEVSRKKFFECGNPVGAPQLHHQDAACSAWLKGWSCLHRSSQDWDSSAGRGFERTSHFLELSITGNTSYLGCSPSKKEFEMMWLKEEACKLILFSLHSIYLESETTASSKTDCMDYPGGLQVATRLFWEPSCVPSSCSISRSTLRTQLLMNSPRRKAPTHSGTISLEQNLTEHKICLLSLSLPPFSL